jgi:cyclase
MKPRTACWKTAAAIVLAALGAMAALAAGEDGGLEVVKVRPNFYMIAGAGANIGVQIGIDGVVLVDAGTAAASPQVLAALKTLTNLPIRYIINTSPEADHVGGNGNLSKSGLTIFTNAIGNSGLAGAMTNNGGAAIMAHESILRRMGAPTGKPALFPAEAMPTEAFARNRWYIRMNDDPIEVLYEPTAQSDSNSFVFFRKSDVVAAGDVLDTTRFPAIDVAKGGSVQGEIDALNKLIELAIPPGPFIYEGIGTYVIPGHGRVCEQIDIVDYRDMVVEVRDNIADLIKQDKTLEQIKAAAPAKAYETEYGTQPGVTDSFVEAVYRSLMAKKK